MYEDGDWATETAANGTTLLHLPLNVHRLIYAGLDKRSFAAYAQSCTTLYAASQLSYCRDIVPVSTETEFDSRLHRVFISNVHTADQLAYCVKSWGNRIEALQFSGQFNQQLPHNGLPGSLRSLTFGYSYNQPILQDTLPENLQHLTFGLLFQQPFEPGVLPQSLESLTLGPYYDQPLNTDVLPKSLRRLIVHASSTQRIRWNQMAPNLSVWYYNSPLARTQ